MARLSASATEHLSPDAVFMQNGVMIDVRGCLIRSSALALTSSEGANASHGCRRRHHQLHPAPTTKHQSGRFDAKIVCAGRRVISRRCGRFVAGRFCSGKHLTSDCSALAPA